MVVGSNGDYHLSYCTNIHPGESWAEVRENLERYLPPLKQNLSPSEPFGVGLRLSNKAAEQLLADDRLSEFASWLTAEDLYVFTINGFPYGSFHHQVVKDRVYLPDWRDRKRVTYTRRLAHILAELVPEDVDGGISTSPISYKPWMDEESYDETYETAARHLAELTEDLVAIRRDTGRLVHIDIEPEPNCLLENTRETTDFFTDWLHTTGRDHLSDSMQISPEAAEEHLRNHIRVCYDTCHFAVEYEQAGAAFDAFEAAGVRIGKVQLSSALRTSIPSEERERTELRERLRPFSEAVYLHQVIERLPEGGTRSFRDLDAALIELESTSGKEWRIHYHVPLFVKDFDGLSSTRDHIVDTLTRLKGGADCSHLEIETYTWDVLPNELKQDIMPSIQREYAWVLREIDDAEGPGFFVPRSGGTRRPAG